MCSLCPSTRSQRSTWPLYGGPATMPNLEAVAAAGTTFDHAISHFPETALSHWSMMTGALPAVHGNVPAYGNSRFTGPTLAERLRASACAPQPSSGCETLTDRSTGMSGDLRSTTMPTPGTERTFDVQPPRSSLRRQPG